MSIITGFFRSDRPAWQKATVSTFAVVLLLITALAINMSPLVRDYEAMAMEAALNNPEVQQIIEDEEIDTENIKIAAVFDTENGLKYYVRIGEKNIVAVELSKWLLNTEIVEVLIETTPVTDTKKQELIEIACTNPEIKALFEQGASIYMYYFDYIPTYLAGDSVLDVAHKASGQPLSIKNAELISDDWVEFTVRFWIELDGNRYYIMLDMMDKSVFSFGLTYI
ncbi:MAG: hypothetical protein GX226_01220 [Dehalococcoidales bacterium]|nr:hypothetical protein [Dehalococcoidales bacterium]